MDKWRAALTSGVFVLVLGGLFAANLLYTPPEILKSERRKPAAPPAFSLEALLSGEYLQGLAQASLDRFVARDFFRGVKARWHFSVYRQLDLHGVFVAEGAAAQLSETNEDMVQAAVRKIRRVVERFGGQSAVYLGAIPDKAAYLGADSGMPVPAPDYWTGLLRESAGDMHVIDLSAVLSAASYYKTDLHWDMAALGPVAERLCGVMGVTPDLDGLVKECYAPFYGVYCGQSALPLPPDTVTTFTGGALAGASVHVLDTRTLQMTDAPMYDLSAWDGVDPYALFLGGPQAVVTLENPGATSDRTLYFFRDSFGSSLAPLLATAYRRIVLIDLRYVDSRALESVCEFEPGSDMLFLYSSQILNHAAALLVS